MGLMMGFSIISVVELAYFFIIKPVIHVWRRIFDRHRVDVQKIDGYELQEFPNVSI